MAGMSTLPNKTRYLAIGLPIGFVNDSQRDPIGTEDPAFWVRAAGQFFHLDVEAAFLWNSALGGVLSRREILDKAAGRDDVDWDSAFDRLLSAELFVEYSEETSLGKLGRLRPVCQGHGLGWLPDSPDQFGIAFYGTETSLKCDLATYILWSHCDGVKLLDEVVAAAAVDTLLPEDKMTTLLLHLIEVLVSTAGVWLDRG